MARIRSIHPGQWTDDQFVMCSFAARLLSIGLRNEADDNGIFVWNPVRIKMQIFPGDNLDIEKLLAELVENNQVVRYSVGEKEYGLIRNFRKYQKPKAPSFLYPPPLNPSDFGNGYDLLNADFSNSDADGEERRGEKGSMGASPPPKAFSKPTVEELTQAFTGKVPDPAREAIRFFNFYESKGWMVGKTKMQSWPHAVGNWASRQRESSASGSDDYYGGRLIQ